VIITYIYIRYINSTKFMKNRSSFLDTISWNSIIERIRSRFRLYAERWFVFTGILYITSTVSLKALPLNIISPLSSKYFTALIFVLFLNTAGSYRIRCYVDWSPHSGTVFFLAWRGTHILNTTVPVAIIFLSRTIWDKSHWLVVA